MADDERPTDGDAGSADDAGDGSGAGSSRPSLTKALSDEDIRDALPEDLDAAGYVGPYLFPNNNRRRIPAVLYWVIAAVCAGLWFVNRDGGSPLVNGGLLWAAIGLVVVGVYSFITGWDLDVDERDALVGWRGLLSRPTWRILLYSAEDPPEKRGLVLVDGVDGSVVEYFVEDNPEDWS